jgi:Phage capsid family
MQAGALHIDLDRFGSVAVPGRSTTIADAGQWIDEGAPIPARQYNLLGPTLRPHKLSVIVTFTREMSLASNIEQILRALIIEAAGPAIDAAVLSTAAATSNKPAGILHGVAPLAAATGSGFDTCAEDLGALIGDIAVRNGGAHAIFIASPAQSMSIRFFTTETIPSVGSAALPAKTVIAIEPSSFASIIGAPEFEVGTVATIHQEDTSPADVGSPPGATGPNVVAAPIKSMFQVDAIALKMTLWGDWCMRAPHVAYMDAVGW